MRPGRGLFSTLPYSRLERRSNMTAHTLERSSERDWDAARSRPLFDVTVFAPREALLLMMSATMLLKTCAIDTLPGIRMRCQTAGINIGAAVIALTILSGINAL